MGYNPITLDREQKIMSNTFVLVADGIPVLLSPCRWPGEEESRGRIKSYIKKTDQSRIERLPLRNEFGMGNHAAISLIMENHSMNN